MKNLTLALMATAAFTSAGCKKKGGGGEAMTKMTELSDKMCACKDAKCAQSVQEEMTKWSQEMAKNAGDKKPEPMSEADAKKYSEATTKFSECMQKAMGAGDTGSAAAGSGSAAAAGSGSAAAGSGSAAAGSGSAATATEAQGSAAPAADDVVADVKDMTLRQPGDQNASNFATATLWDSKSKNGEQYDIQIQDVRNRPYMIKEFETPPEGKTKETVGAYPALVQKGMFGPELVVLVNKGGLVASATTARGAPVKDIEALKKAVQMMDLAGLEKNDLKKPELNGKILAKYLPKLPAAK